MGLQSCATLFGTGPRARIAVPADAIVTDLTTGKELNVYQVTADSQYVLVPNGKSYAFRFDFESRVGYHLIKPKRDYLTLLGWIGLGSGIVVDHLTRSFYTYPAQGAVTPSFVPVDGQQALEARLKKEATWMTPASVIDDRDTMVCVPFFTDGFDFLLYHDADPTERIGFGVGLQIFPSLMPFVEAGVSHRDSLASGRPWFAVGLQLQEPANGFCAGLRLGLNAENPNRQFGSPAAYVAGSGGIYGQWGRFELRYRHNLSWYTLPEDPPASRGYIGFQYSFQVYL